MGSRQIVRGLKTSAVSTLFLFPAQSREPEATNHFRRTTRRGHELLLHITPTPPLLPKVSSPVSCAAASLPPSGSSIRQIIDGQKRERNVITRNEKVERGTSKGAGWPPWLPCRLRRETDGHSWTPWEVRWTSLQ